ncbi:MAG: hypothetical protein QRY71_05220 [Candidatus Rhabdochlamydia sp.]
MIVNMAVIQFISSPLYEVDFTQFEARSYKNPPPSFDQKIIQVAIRSFIIIQAAALALAGSLYQTASYFGTSFQYHVIGYNSQKNTWEITFDIPLIVLKIAFCVLSSLFCIVTTFTRLFIHKLSINQEDNPLRLFLSASIQLSHIRTKELILEAKHVSDEIQIDTLLTFFDEINFTHTEEIGYMDQGSLKEDEKTYTPDELRSLLQTVLQRIHQKTAFIGTPPSYDIPRLMQFYEQIENALRLSLNKSHQDLVAFENRYGKNCMQYSSSERGQYEEILLTRARMVIDIALTGNHCGGRLMGDAMNSYYGMHQMFMNMDLSLKEHLTELLAHQRKQIAESQIQKHFGNHSQNTHYFNLYLKTLGPLLGIPGTRHIDEPLLSSLDKATYLKLFFEDYNENCIILTIQRHIQAKEGHPLREKITEWLKSEMRTWNQDHYTALYEKELEILRPICHQKYSNAPLPHLFTLFIELIDAAKQKNLLQIKISTISGQTFSLTELLPISWESFLEELFALSQVKSWLGEKYPVLLERRKHEEHLSSLLSQKSLGEKALTSLKRYILEEALPLELEPFQAAFHHASQISQIQKINPFLEQDTIKRILTGIESLETSLYSAINRQRQDEFLGHFPLEDLAENGLSPEMMEWMLVSQGIFFPQELIQKEISL